MFAFPYMSSLPCRFSSLHPARSRLLVLKLDPSSTEAFKALLFLLLQTDQYATALDAISTYTSSASPSSSSSTAYQFERAYCLYRLHRSSEALVILSDLKKQASSSASSSSSEEPDYTSEQSRKLLNLEAQILYRAGRYQESRTIFQALLDHTPATDSAIEAEVDAEDIAQNLKATETRIEFEEVTYRQALDAVLSSHAGAGVGEGAGEEVEVDLEKVEETTPEIPSSMTSRATKKVSGVQTSKISGGKGAATGAGAANAKGKGKSGAGEVTVQRKPRHKLPKGAVVGKAFTEDVSSSCFFFLLLFFPSSLHLLYVSTVQDEDDYPSFCRPRGGGGSFLHLHISLD